MRAEEILKEVWPQWRIERELGAGSFGRVYEIRRQDIGGEYRAALKLIRIPQSENEIRDIMTEGMDQESATEYFRGIMEELVREFSMMERLKGNTNIVTYEDHAVVPHREAPGWDILIRMELLTPLTQYMEGRAMGGQDAVRLGIDICRALELCGKYKIIHRDIKPENIFVSDFGDFKLGDFGVARTAERTMAGMSKKGTYTYMAPEVYKGEAYNATVDLYSLGIVLYRMLNDYRAPFLPAYPNPITFGDREKAQEMRMTGAAFPAAAHAGERMNALLRRACAFLPADRFASAAEMRLALEALETKETPPAGEETADVWAAGVRGAEQGAENGRKNGGGTASGAPGTASGAQGAKMEKAIPGVQEKTETAGLWETDGRKEKESPEKISERRETGASGADGPAAAQTADAGGKKRKRGLIFGLAAGGAAALAAVALFLGLALGGRSSGEGTQADAASSQEREAQKTDQGDAAGQKADGREEETGEPESDILPAKVTADLNTGNLIVPEGFGAEAHDSGQYPMEALFGYWVVEGYVSGEDIHPTETTMEIDTGEETAVLERFPETMNFGPESRNATDITLSDNIEKYKNKYAQMGTATFSMNKLRESGDTMGMMANVFYDTSGDTLGIGFPRVISETEAEITEVDYKISWTGWKLTLTSGEESVTYVPYVTIRDEEEGIVTVGGNLIKGYPLIDEIVGIWPPDHIVCQDQPFSSTEARFDFREDGSLTIDTGEGSHEFEYLYSGDCTTLRSGEETAVFYIGAAYWFDSVLEDSVEEEALEGMEEDEKKELAQEHTTVLNRLKDAFSAAGLDVNIDEVTGRVTLDSSILFAFDDAALSEEGKAFLDKFLNAYASVILSEECASYVSQIVIEGHTDTVGEYDYNLVLSKERADSVVNYCLAENSSGLDAEQLARLSQMMTSVGRSSDEPVYAENGEVDMDASRRVVFKFMMNTGS